MLPNNFTNNNFITKQLKLPLEIEKIIDISDPVYTFCDVIDHIDLKSYFAGAVAVKVFVAKISRHYIVNFKFILYIQLFN